MRRYDAEYLEHTRQGMWDDSREALSSLELSTRQRVLDVGSGIGALTRVLREEVPGQVVGVDADRTLLEHADGPVVVGDAHRLPFVDGAFDLVICQALLINLLDPVTTLEEFARVSRDRVAVVEPDNSAVWIDSTVEREAKLADRARTYYLDGVGTDVTLGADARSLLADAGLSEIDVTRYEHARTVSPPYSKRDLQAARRKASGRGLEDDRPTMLAGGLTAAEYDALRSDWRAMGRAAVEQMQNGVYERTETVPFYVAVGTV
ncbi:MAG: class I SAM-dependent methyltransferase [Halorhabdus sp.]